MSEIKIEDKKLMTPEFRVSFPQVFEPKAFGGSEPKYSIVMLLPKKGDLSKFKTAAKNAAIEQWGAKADAVLAKLKGTKGWPFRDGDAEKADMKGYPGHYFITAKSKQKPGLVNGKREAILDKDEFYAGCFARATLIAYAYDNEFGKGIGFSLQNIQKLKDGEKFSGKRDAEDEFDEVEDTSDDSSNYPTSGEEDDLGF